MHPVTDTIYSLLDMETLERTCSEQGSVSVSRLSGSARSCAVGLLARQFTDQGKTVLIITPTIESAEDTADDIAALGFDPLSARFNRTHIYLIESH